MINVNFDTVFDDNNINEALKIAKKSKGACGIDKVCVKEVDEYWSKYGKGIKYLIKEKRYIPVPMLCVYISKGKPGEKRKIAIPSVADRALQHMLLIPMSKLYEEVFSENSFGFRKNRGTLKALERCMNYIEQGYIYAADIDLYHFFDTINHNLLISILKKNIKDDTIINLILRYLRADICERGKMYRNTIGIPQGNPISPLLANVMLNELDVYLDELGYKFVRYADDIIILCKSFEEAQNAMKNAKSYIEEFLMLKVNNNKTKIEYIDGIKYMGYVLQNKKNGCVLDIGQNTVEKAEKRIREYTAKKKKINMHEMWNLIGAFNRGWINYFRFAEPERLEQILLFLDNIEHECIRKICMQDTVMNSLFAAKEYVSCIEWYKNIKEEEKNE